MKSIRVTRKLQKILNNEVHKMSKSKNYTLIINRIFRHTSHQYFDFTFQTKIQNTFFNMKFNQQSNKQPQQIRGQNCTDNKSWFSFINFSLEEQQMSQQPNQSGQTNKTPKENKPRTDVRSASCSLNVQTTSIDLRNYILSMPPFYYPYHPYFGFNYPPSAFLPPFQHPYPPPRLIEAGFRAIQGASSVNSAKSQSMCANSRSNENKSQKEVINLDSDESNDKSNVPCYNSSHKQSSESAEVIRINLSDDDPMDQVSKRSQIQASNSSVKKQQSRNNLQQKNSYKISEKRVRKINPIVEQIKAKLTKKIQKKCSKSQKLSQSTQRKPKMVYTIKNKVSIGKQVLKNQKKRHQKQEKTSIAYNSDKFFEKSIPKQITKYMQSHGQIRRGEQFQSFIPQIKILSNIDFNSWIKQKRERLLKKEIIAFTY